MSTFLKLHHGFLEHEKHADLSREALLLHISGLMYASRELTDGRLSKGRVPRAVWSAWVSDLDVDALATELIDAGVWENWPGHFQIVNYVEHNNTRQQVEEARAADRERKRLAREKAKAGKGLNRVETDTETETGIPATVHEDSDRSPVGQPGARTKLRSIRNGAA